MIINGLMNDDNNKNNDLTHCTTYKHVLKLKSHLWNCFCVNKINF